jgi:hypothetical protein
MEPKYHQGFGYRKGKQTKKERRVSTPLSSFFIRDCYLAAAPWSGLVEEAPDEDPG